MLKNSTSSLSNAKELAKNLININSKWNNLNKKIDMKNRLFAQLGDYINELRRNFDINIVLNGFIKGLTLKSRF